MLAQTFSAAAVSGCQGALGMVLNNCRTIVTSVCACSGSPTYVYTPPGSSVSDPSYYGKGHEEPSQPLPDSKVMRPSKKAQWLKFSTRHARELESQSQKPGAMLPPGCSMSDPHYSIRDPVYFVDNSK